MAIKKADKLMKGIRTHDKIYLKKKINNNIKFVYKKFLSLIKNRKVKSILDVGIGDGELLKLLEESSNIKKIYGCDNNKSLIRHAKKKLIKTKLFKENILKLENNDKFDFVHASGLLHIYDDPEKLISNLIKKTKKGGTIFICTFLEENQIDIITRYKLPNLQNYNKPIIEMGWNKFSKFTIRQILKNNKKIKNYKFIKINFPAELKIFKQKDLLRSWTIKKKDNTYFQNAIFTQRYFYIEINLL